MPKNPVLVVSNFCVDSRIALATAANAPAHNPHLDPCFIILTDQGPPRISLRKEKETNSRFGTDPHHSRVSTQPDAEESGTYGAPSGSPKILPAPDFCEYEK